MEDPGTATTGDVIWVEKEADREDPLLQTDLYLMSGPAHAVPAVGPAPVGPGQGHAHAVGLAVKVAEVEAAPADRALAALALEAHQALLPAVPTLNICTETWAVRDTQGPLAAPRKRELVRAATRTEI